MEKTKVITINNIPEGSEIYTLEEVLRLVKEGYTSGVDPNFDIADEE